MTDADFQDGRCGSQIRVLIVRLLCILVIAAIGLTAPAGVVGSRGVSHSRIATTMAVTVYDALVKPPSPTEHSATSSTRQIEVSGRLSRESSGSLAGVLTAFVAADTAGSLSDVFANGAPKALDLSTYAENQGWKASQTATGPLKYTDDNGVVRMTIKRGSARTPGSENPHVELRGPDGQRIDPSGNSVTRNSPGNHTPINWDLP